MLRLRARSRLILGWIAIWAIAIGGTSSVAARAPGDLSGTGAGALTGHEVCTAAGLALGDIAGGVSLPFDAPAGHAAGHAGHCVFCSLHADTLAPPPAPACERAVGPGVTTRSLDPQAEPARRDDWVAAQPRAPPPAIG